MTRQEATEGSMTEVWAVIFSNYEPAEVAALYDNQEAAEAHADAEWVVGIAGRLTCRLLRWHNITCRGRPDHTAHEAIGVSLIDPDRWNRWPRR